MTVNGWIALAALGVLMAAPPAAADDHGAEPMQDAGIRPLNPPRHLPPPGLPPAPTCRAGQTACMSLQTTRWACVNLQTDRTNCGSCNNRCPPDHACVGGGCAPP